MENKPLDGSYGNGDGNDKSNGNGIGNGIGNGNGNGNGNNTTGAGKKPRKRKLKVLRIIGVTIAGIAVACLFALLFGLVVKWLWNWLMPMIFGLPEVTYWQAFGLVLLSKLLFGSFGHGHGDSCKRDHHENGRCGPDHGKAEKKFRRWIGLDENDTCGFDEPDCWEPKGSHKNWKYYPKYWKEEGKEHFEKYIEQLKNEEG